MRKCYDGKLDGSYKYSSFILEVGDECRYQSAHDSAIKSHGEKLTAYKYKTVPYPHTDRKFLDSRTRTCKDGLWNSPSEPDTENFGKENFYPYLSQTYDLPSSCSFNGQTINHSETTTAYRWKFRHPDRISECQSLTDEAAYILGIPKNSKETRTCNNGTLSGSYLYSSCSAATVVDSCLVDEQTVKLGERRTSYKSRAFGSESKTGLCSSEKSAAFKYVEYRRAQIGDYVIGPDGTINSTWSGFDYLSTEAPRSCNLNGETIEHGNSVKRFAHPKVNFDKTCTEQIRTCSNGKLSGNYINKTCEVSASPASCIVDGQEIPPGDSQLSYTKKVYDFGETPVSKTGTCNYYYENSSWNGYPYLSYTIKDGASCTIDGTTVNHNSSVTTYSGDGSSPDYLDWKTDIDSKESVCYNGTLSPEPYPFTSYTERPPKGCKFGEIVAGHNERGVAYDANEGSPAYMFELKYRCEHGLFVYKEYSHRKNYVKRETLYRTVGDSYGTTKIEHPFSSYEPKRVCRFRNEGRDPIPLYQNAPHGTSHIEFFTSATVAKPQTCEKFKPTCDDGTWRDSMGGSKVQPSKTCIQMKECSLDGQTIAHGQTVTAYNRNSWLHWKEDEPSSQIRSCYNGRLNGHSNYRYISYQRVEPKDCKFNYETVKHGEYTIAYKKKSYTLAEWNNDANEHRTCDDGKLSGSYKYNAFKANGSPNVGIGCERYTKPGGKKLFFDFDSSQLFYKREAVRGTYGTSYYCSAQSQTCTGHNRWTGSSSYNLISCTDYIFRPSWQRRTSSTSTVESVQTFGKETTIPSSIIATVEKPRSASRTVERAQNMKCLSSETLDITEKFPNPDHLGQYPEELKACTNQCFTGQYYWNTMPKFKKAEYSKEFLEDQQAACLKCEISQFHQDVRSQCYYKKYDFYMTDHKGRVIE